MKSCAYLISMEFDYTQYPQLNSSDISSMKHDCWYDAPISGWCVYQNEQYYFLMVDQNDYENLPLQWFRRYGLFIPTQEEIVIQKRSCTFEMYTSTHQMIGWVEF